MPNTTLHLSRKQGVFLRTIFMILCLLFSIQLAQSQVTLSGFIKDAKTGEVLIGAYVHDSITGKVASSNTNGYFSIQLNNKANLSFSYVGYEKHKFKLNIAKDSIVNIRLKAGTKLNEVVVKATKRQKFNTSTMSIKELEGLPSLGGKPDVLKAMQLLPGIQSQSEASSMLIVRGGDPGQNLYLLDNTPLIYVNHLGGFMSVFNSDMINDISILKGGFPAEYGGKLSSIVNITQRNGDEFQQRGSFGIGITDINATIEGPLGKKGSYIITGRKTMFDMLLLLASGISKENNAYFTYGFHDLNGKFTWRLNQKNKLWLNVYQGDDYLNYRTKISNTGPKLNMNTIWGNCMIAGHWNSLINAKLFSETSMSFTRYRLKEKQKISGTSSADLKDIFIASVDDISIKNKWNYKPQSWLKLGFGINSSYLRHTPHNYENDEAGENKQVVRINSFQNALFLDTEIKPFSKLSLNIGIRAVNYYSEGFTDNSFEPRLGLNYYLTNNITANISYMKVKQNSHLLFTTGSIASNEVWIPATKGIDPAVSEQISVGFISNFLNNQWNMELSGYYKTMNQLSTYKSGEINLKGDADWVSKIETGGSGLSYGLEFFVKKNYGNWIGSMGYTWSKTNRQYSGINQGNEYVFDFDRPHSFSAFVNRKLSEKWDFSAVWIYQTGLPFTPAIGRQYTTSLDINRHTNESFYYEALVYGERNSGRIPSYHRLDIGLNYTTKSKRGNKVVWNFSVYNLYNRHNPNFVYYDYYGTQDTHHPEHSESGYKPLDIYQTSLFPILPSISYKVFFDGTKREKNPIKNRLKGLLFYEE